MNVIEQKMVEELAAFPEFDQSALIGSTPDTVVFHTLAPHKTDLKYIYVLAAFEKGTGGVAVFHRVRDDKLNKVVFNSTGRVYAFGDLINRHVGHRMYSFSDESEARKLADKHNLVYEPCTLNGILVPRTLSELADKYDPQFGIEPFEISSRTQEQIAQMGEWHRLGKPLSHDVDFEDVARAQSVVQAMNGLSSVLPSLIGRIARNAVSVLDRHGLPYRKPAERDADERRFCQELAKNEIVAPVYDLAAKGV